MTFTVRQVGGTAGELHALTVPDDADPEVWWFEPTRPAVALGSRQRATTLSAVAVDDGGFDVVHRRSGGGAVLIVPGELVWLDVVVPAGHPAWRADVARSMEVIGDAWVAALQSLDVADLTVHRGPMVRTVWSDLVCFDGIGPGEVLQGSAKLVGISQRRTRAAARFQCAMYLSYESSALTRLLSETVPVGQLRPVATVPYAEASDVAQRLARALEV